jgi:hypothetical protein
MAFPKQHGPGRYNDKSVGNQGAIFTRPELTILMSSLRFSALPSEGTDAFSCPTLPQILALERSAVHNASPATVTRSGVKQRLKGHVGDFAAMAVGSRAHLEKQAIAKVGSKQSFILVCSLLRHVALPFCFSMLSV